MKLTMGEQLTKEWRKTFKTGDKLARLYYETRTNCCACASWDTFKNSWAGQEWIKRNKNLV